MSRADGGGEWYVWILWGVGVRLVAKECVIGCFAWVEKCVDRLSGESGNYLYNQWEMRSGDFGIRNPAWNNFVQKIAGRAAKDLGVKADASGPVRAEMSTVRLWKVGACLQPCKECVHLLDLKWWVF